MSKSSKAGWFGIGVIGGLAVGIIAAILHETSSAETTRELLRERDRQARYKSAEYAERARDSISKARKRAKANSDQA